MLDAGRRHALRGQCRRYESTIYGMAAGDSRTYRHATILMLLLLVDCYDLSMSFEALTFAFA
jgi:hypothetical protein